MFFFLIKLINAKEYRGQIFCTFAGMTSLTLNSKLCNLLKSDQNTTKLHNRPFLHKINKIMSKKEKNRGEALALGTF